LRAKNGVEEAIIFVEKPKFCVWRLTFQGLRVKDRDLSGNTEP
jgi:hypothetical protein